MEKVKRTRHRFDYSKRGGGQRVFTYGKLKTFIVKKMQDKLISQITGYDLISDQEIHLPLDDLTVVHYDEFGNKEQCPLTEGSFYVAQSCSYQIYHKDKIIMEVEPCKMQDFIPVSDEVKMVTFEEI